MKEIGVATSLHISTCTSRVAVSNCTFRNNSGKEGGALYVEKSEDLVVFNSSFSFNKALCGGGAIYCADSRISTNGRIYSFSNSAETSNGGYAYFSNCNVVTEDPNAEYEYHSNNQASNGGAIYAERGTNIQFKYNTTITTASNNGGALYLDQSRVRIFSSMKLILSKNVAKSKGGAIFVPDTNCETTTCFFNADGNEGYHIIFTNNTAHQGPVLYGGLLDRCYVDDSNRHKLAIDVLKYEHTPEAITSHPVRICLCTENHELNCTLRSLTVSDKSAGQIINLLGTVVDQDNNPKASYI